MGISNAVLELLGEALGTSDKTLLIQKIQDKHLAD